MTDAQALALIDDARLAVQKLELCTSQFWGMRAWGGIQAARGALESARGTFLDGRDEAGLIR
tara:strand:- start:540 stop:725 length:186 start_codon:yes stop_codon:yes gene_type:complete